MPLSLIALASAAASAEHDPLERVVLAHAAPIVVSARAPVGVAELGGSLSVVTRADLERLQVPLLLDALRLQPGVGVTRNGGPGGFTAVRLRGAEGEQTTVVIDGVKVADVASPGGGFDFGSLVSAGIARVEILRGPQSLAWGSQAIGGVIAIETANPRTLPPLSARLEAGARQSWLTGADLAFGQGPLAVGISGNWQRTDGISAFAEARGGNERDDFETFGGSVRADLRLAEGLSLDARGRFQQSDFGVDGFPPPAFQFADTPDRGFNRDLSGSMALKWSADAVRVRAGWQAADNRRRSYTPGRMPESSFRSSGRLERLDAGVEWDFDSRLSFSGGFERELVRLDSASPSAFDPQPDPFRARATLTGGFAQAIARPLRGLSLLVGLRHDDHSLFGGVTTLAVSGSWAIGDGPARLRASWGQGFKAPTLFQLFSDFGNPALQPERADGWDVGADTTLAGGMIRASATWFQRQTRNQIDFVSCFGSASPICTDRPFGTYENIARTRARGLELVLGLQPLAGLTVDVAYDWLDASNTTEGPNQGKPLARRPEHSLSLVADWRWRNGAGIGATLAHVSSSFDDAANRNRLAGFVTLDLRGSVPVGAIVELTARVTNVTDSVHETVRFYGQPGRQAFVGLRAKL